jgi:hypothetical protein
MMSRAAILPIYLILPLAFAFFIGCSQSVDDVKVNRRVPAAGQSIILNADLSGASTNFPTSASRIMGDHSLGGNGLRTSSASASLRMTSGIGVE